MKYRIPLVALLAMTAVSAGCSSPAPVGRPFLVTSRQFPPEPVHGKFTWNHQPAPAPVPAEGGAPLLEPSATNMRKAETVREAVAEVAQKLGYRAECNQVICDRPVSVPLTGSAGEIASELDQQGGIATSIDHEQRTVVVRESTQVPMLPPARTLP